MSSTIEASVIAADTRVEAANSNDMTCGTTEYELTGKGFIAVIVALGSVFVISVALILLLSGTAATGAAETSAIDQIFSRGVNCC